jgi:hypothetical protein
LRRVVVFSHPAGWQGFQLKTSPLLETYPILSMRSFILLPLASLLTVISSAAADPARWQVPLAGNSFLTEGKSQEDRVRRDGIRWQDPASTFSAFFHVDIEADIDLSLRLRVPQGESTLKAEIAGKTFEIKASGAEFHEVAVGKIQAKPGYVQVKLSGAAKSGPVFAEISDLVIRSATPEVKASFVRNNEGNMFYWGRRGPSVHLGYQMPRDKKIEYAYSEINVPAGEDPPGSYFMANGFGQGYFGIQVKSDTERWVLFSVWSPHNTDRPSEIPEDKRVVLLKKGEGVRGGEFGGEGSGGQSILVYPWKSGTTYRFLTSVRPDGKGATVYTSWFGELGKPEWKLIASFKRPHTDTHLTGFHSFLENFYDFNGFLERRSLHGNQWVCDTDGKWHEITSARFTGDGTAGGGHRLDYAGGVSGSGFFMRNGGFFSDRVPINQSFTRPATPDRKPQIDFEALDKP